MCVCVLALLANGSGTIANWRNIVYWSSPYNPRSRKLERCLKRFGRRSTKTRWNFHLFAKTRKTRATLLEKLQHCSRCNIRKINRKTQARLTFRQRSRQFILRKMSQLVTSPEITLVNSHVPFAFKVKFPRIFSNYPSNCFGAVV